MYIHVFSALLLELKLHELDPQKAAPDVELLSELNKYLEWAGIYDPYEKIYVETKNYRNVSVALFLLTISHLPKLIYVKNMSTLIGKKLAEHIDGTAFVVGTMTILKQYHSDILQLFIDYLAQYVNSMAEYTLK